MDFLQDYTFLQKVNRNKIREYWAAIMILDFATERPIQRIEAKVIGGNINVAANSPVRRSGTLNLVFDKTTRNITDVQNLIAIDKKVAISIGFSNPLYDDEQYRHYGDILWFRQGVFIITKANTSFSTSSSQVSINFIDKMGFLNGTCGGVLPSTVSFHELIITDEKGNTSTDHPLIWQIIQECVHHYGGEHPSKIIIEDIEDVGRQVVTYQGTTPINFATVVEEGETNGIVRKLQGNFQIGQPPIENFSDTYFKGDVVGYIETPLTYPGELIMRAGSTVTAVLDQIVNALGNYEYFYDVEGVFHFRKKRNYLTTGNAPLNFGVTEVVGQDNSGNVISKVATDETIQNYYLPRFDMDYFLNEFGDESLLTSVNYNPNYENIKNDFIVWGTRNSNEESAKMVRYHLTIDQRPKKTDDNLCDKSIYAIYQPFPKKYDEETGEEIIDETVGYKSVEQKGTIIKYQLTPDHEDGYESELVCRPLRENFPNLDEEYWFNWREELYRMALLAYGNSTDVSISTDGSAANPWAYYFEELRAEWRYLYDPESSTGRKGDSSFQTKWEDYFGPRKNDCPWYGYCIDVAINPGKIHYWFDIIDDDGIIGKYSVRRIGRRTVAKENSKVNEVYANQPNDIVFIDTTNEDWKYKEQLYGTGADENGRLQDRLAYYNSIGQTYCILGKQHIHLFSKINSYGTCFDDIRELLYSNLIYNSSISLTCIPLFYFDVNRIVRLNFPDKGIQGDYIINQISWSIGATATMNLSLQEALVIN